MPRAIQAAGGTGRTQTLGSLPPESAPITLGYLVSAFMFEFLLAFLLLLEVLTGEERQQQEEHRHRCGRGTRQVRRKKRKPGPLLRSLLREEIDATAAALNQSIHCTLLPAAVKRDPWKQEVGVHRCL